MTEPERADAVADIVDYLDGIGKVVNRLAEPTRSILRSQVFILLAKVQSLIDPEAPPP